MDVSENADCGLHVVLVVQASARQLDEYESLQRGGAQSVVCDRCLQPIEGHVFKDNLARLRAQVAAAQEAQQQVEVNATRSQASCAGPLVHRTANFQPGPLSMCIYWLC